MASRPSHLATRLARPLLGAASRTPTPAEVEPQAAPKSQPADTPQTMSAATHSINMGKYKPFVAIGYDYGNGWPPFSFDVSTGLLLVPIERLPAESKTVTDPRTNAASVDPTPEVLGIVASAQHAQNTTIHGKE